MKRVCYALVLCAATLMALSAQTFNTLYTFTGQTDGANPDAGLVQATDGSLYGNNLGSLNYSPGGVIYKINPSGAFTIVYNFCVQFGDCPNGERPISALIEARNGYLYGTASEGGVGLALGTVFELNKSDGVTRLYYFCSIPGCTDGASPYGGLVQAGNGSFYGTTYGGGSDNSGTVYQITPGGALTTFYSFACLPSGLCPNGQSPESTLIQGADGNLYGTTAAGGTAADAGTIFKITLTGTLNMLYTFCVQTGCPDGQIPSGLVQGTDGSFYGTTQAGGSGGSGTVFKFQSGGRLHDAVQLLRKLCVHRWARPDGRADSGD